jgi:uncharacterized protein (TIGR03437 family)
MATSTIRGIVGTFVLLFVSNLSLIGQCTPPKDVLVGTTLSPGFDMGVSSSGIVTNWLVDERTHFRMSYPAGQSWGAVFVTVGAPVSSFPRRSMDFSACQTLLIEMRGEKGGEEVDIGVKDNTQPDNGTETKLRVSLSANWRIYAFPLSKFVRADLKNLYVVTEFVFDGTAAETVFFRLIRYTTQPAPSVASVVSAASFQPGVAGGGWISIFGTALAATTRPWGTGDIQGTKLPKALDGTAVSIADRDLVVSYVSPTQINALVPFDLPEGQAYAVVTNAVGSSVPVSVKVTKTQPALFVFPAENGKYAAAVHPDGVYVGKAGLLGAGVAVRPAQPNGVVSFYGTGFGPTNPACSAVDLYQGAFPLPDQDQLRIRIANLNAEITFAGAVTPGLYQFNVKIPNVADGDQLVIIEHRGATTQPNVFVTVQR